MSLQDRLKQPRISNVCSCVGPKNSEPVCPCAMRSVKIIAGRYVQVIDLGPAPIKAQLAQSIFTVEQRVEAEDRKLDSRGNA